MATTRPPARSDHPPTAIAHRVTPPLGRRVLANLATAELVEDGMAVIPEGVGLCLELDEERVARMTSGE